MNYIDLFAGAGGLSEGFLQEHFNVIAHVEMNSDAAYTLKTRACYYYLKEINRLDIYYDYLRKNISREELYSYVPEIIFNKIINETISDKSINEIFNTIDELIVNENINNVDLIIGGPPCQAYSLVGRAVKDDGMENDSRNYLYRLYCRFLKKYQPKMFVFENVPGLKSANNGKHFINIRKYMSRVGYNVDFRELNAKDYGVLQSRKRIIIIGWRKDLDLQYPDIESLKHNFKVSDLLEDLPSIQAGESNNQYSTTDINEYLERFNIRTENDVLNFHVSRPNIERDRQIYRIVINTWNKYNKRVKYTDLPDELKTHKNITSFLDRFKVVAGNSQYCHTVLAHISKDGHYFIHPDYDQARSITVREAARIQSFPDNYYFEGSRTAAFTQIGNAVPPLMAKAIAKAILRKMEDLNE